MTLNGTMMQYFEWYLPPQILWKQLKKEAPQLAREGITGAWVPPCYKGAYGKEDVGYATYDLYDLGEFDQKGTIPTQYTTKAQLLEAIKTCHQNAIQVYADVTLDHKIGADGTEKVLVQRYNPTNREEKLSTEMETI